MFKTEHDARDAIKLLKQRCTERGWPCEAQTDGKQNHWYILFAVAEVVVFGVENVGFYVGAVMVDGNRTVQDPEDFDESVPTVGKVWKGFEEIARVVYVRWDGGPLEDAEQANIIGLR